MAELLPLLIFLGVIYVFAIYPKQRKKKILSASATLDVRLTQLRGDVVAVASSSIPGKDIQNVVGTVTGVSGTQAGTKEEFELAEKEALIAIIEKAHSMGANAITDLALSTGTCEQQGSKWQVSQVIYNGTAVVTS